MNFSYLNYSLALGFAVSFFASAPVPAEQPSSLPLFQVPLLDAGVLTLVGAKVSGIPGDLPLILDTGNQGALMLDSRNARHLGLPLRVETINEKEATGTRYAVSQFQVGRLVNDRSEAFTTDLSAIRFFIGDSIQGILGWDLLRRHVLSYDFD